MDDTSQESEIMLAKQHHEMLLTRRRSSSNKEFAKRSQPGDDTFHFSIGTLLEFAHSLNVKFAMNNAAQQRFGGTMVDGTIYTCDGATVVLVLDFRATDNNCEMSVLWI